MTIVHSTASGNAYSVSGSDVEYLGAGYDGEAIREADEENYIHGIRISCGCAGDVAIFDGNGDFCGGDLTNALKSKDFWQLVDYCVNAGDAMALRTVCDRHPNALFKVTPLPADDLRLLGLAFKTEKTPPRVISFQRNVRLESIRRADCDEWREVMEKYPDMVLFNMAQCLSRGGWAWNMVYKTPVGDGFGGSFLKLAYAEGYTDTCICTPENASYYFRGVVSNSLLESAAPRMPVAVETTPLFRKDTGCELEKVKLLISCQDNPLLSHFMGALHLVTGRLLFWSGGKAPEMEKYNVFANGGYCVVRQGVFGGIKEL